MLRRKILTGFALLLATSSAQAGTDEVMSLITEGTDTVPACARAIDCCHRAGVPVVATALAEIAEAVDDGRTGCLVPPDDAAALAEALRRTVAPGARAAFGDAGREVFATRYRLDAMTRAYERLYAAAPA